MIYSALAQVQPAQVLFPALAVVLEVLVADSVEDLHPVVGLLLVDLALLLATSAVDQITLLATVKPRP